MCPRKGPRKGPLKKIKPVKVISEISPIPVLFLSGGKDPIIYRWHSEELFRSACEPKSLIMFPNGLHAEELYLKSKKEFLDACMDWHKRILMKDSE